MSRHSPAQALETPSARPNDEIAVRSARSSCSFRFPRTDIGDRVSKCFQNRKTRFFKSKTGWSLPWLNDDVKFRYLILGVPVIAQANGRGFDQIVIALEDKVFRVFVHVSILTAGFGPAPVDGNSMFGSPHCVFAFNQTMHVNQNRWRESGEDHPAMPHISSCS